MTGIVRSGMTEVDRSLMQIDRSTFDQLFSMDGAINRVKVLVEAENLLASVRKQIDLILSNALSEGSGKRIVTRTWDELIPGLKQAIELDMSASWMFYGALLLVCAISVLNTFLMAVLEREGEFALLLSLGLSPVQIGLSIVIESTLLVAIGLVVGAFAACGLIWYFGNFGFIIPGSEEMLKIWGLPSRLYPRFLPVPWIRGLSAVAVVGVLALLVPLIRLRSISPTDARR